MPDFKSKTPKQLNTPTDDSVELALSLHSGRSAARSSLRLRSHASVSAERLPASLTQFR
jgi:hypothetical protein